MMISDIYAGDDQSADLADASDGGPCPIGLVDAVEGAGPAFPDTKNGETGNDAISDIDASDAGPCAEALVQQIDGSEVDTMEEFFDLNYEN